MNEPEQYRYRVAIPTVNNAEQVLTYWATRLGLTLHDTVEITEGRLAGRTGEILRRVGDREWDRLNPGYCYRVRCI